MTRADIIDLLARNFDSKQDAVDFIGILESDGYAIMRKWEPAFCGTVPEQERLVEEFCQEIAEGPVDPVRLLEMAEALYRAERDAQEAA